MDMAMNYSYKRKLDPQLNEIEGRKFLLLGMLKRCSEFLYGFAGTGIMKESSWATETL